MELLIVIGILAILAAAAVIAINPGELLKRSRDSRRMGDIAVLNRALAVIQSLNPNVSMGSANTVYISIPDNASSACGSLGLPPLPENWQYHCVSEANLQKVNGAGWVPVDFASAAGLSSPLASLPIDSVNSTTSNQYYTYVTGGSWKLPRFLNRKKWDQQLPKMAGFRIQPMK